MTHICSRVTFALGSNFLGEPLTVEENRQVFAIDDDVLWHEFVQLMGAALSDDEPALASTPIYDFMGFEPCREEYLRLFTALSE